MSENNFISDEKFVPFLQSLGVETYNKSFEWLQSDTEIAGLLGWIYNNVDHNNALTAREECRYSELVKQGKVLSPEELEASVRHIQDEFKGICLPGDHDGLEDVKLDISQHTEKLTMLNKQEEILKELIQENQSTNQELTMELTKLSAAQQQAADDERSAGEECVNLAKQMKAITRDVVDTVADSLHMYSTCAVDKEVGKRFFTYIPFETYRQTQELFKMRVDSFMSLKFDNKHNDSIYDEITSALSLADSMEARLSDAAYEYIESKVNLSGEEASLSVIGNYVIGQPIQYISRESHESAIQWLEQEVSILEQQIRSAVKSFAEQRTNLFHHTIANSELVVREQMYKELTFLHDIISEAVALDGLLYSALRRELHSAQELVYFTSDLRLHLLQETEFIEKRIKSMHRTRMEQEQAENELQKSDFLLNSLIRILDGEPTGDPLLPVKLYNAKRRNIRDLNNEILYEYGKKEAALEDIKNQAKPLYKYIWDGCTKQPNRHNRSVSCLNHALTTEMAAVSDRVVQISKLYNDVKSGDEFNFRKIWQWFLADPTKLLEALHHPRK